MHFIITGKVKPYVRMTQRGKWVKEDAKEYLASQAAIGWQLKEQMQQFGLTMLPTQTALAARIVFDIPRRMHGCDLDNLEKAVIDAAQGIVFKNDCWIDAKFAHRRCSDKYETRLTVWEYGRQTNETDLL